MEQARQLLERALALEEGSADAHALMAHVVMTFVNYNWAEDRQKSMDLADQHVARALDIDAKHTRGHYVRGMIHQVQRRFGEAIAEFELVIDAVPGWAVAYMRRGAVRILTGQPEEGMADILEAMRISPRDPYIDGWYGGLGLACLMLGRDAEALDHYLRGRAGAVGGGIQPDLASVYAMLGRAEEARTALADYQLARPESTLKSLRARWFGFSENPLYLVTRQRQIDALRRIGMREE
jgi:tetratricopeptide (TPR) repeat protein